MTGRASVGTRWSALREPVVLAVIAFSLRLAVPAIRGVETHHAHGYHYYLEMADHLVAGDGLHRTLPYGHGDRHAIRTPLYPLVLAAFRGLPVSTSWLVVLFGAACGTGTVLLARAWARRLFGARAGTLAGVLLAAWPHAVIHDTALQDTALYTVLFTAFVLLVHGLARPPEGALPSHRLAVLAGAAGALAVLTRVALLPSVVALLAWVVPAARGSRLAAARRVGLAVTVFALALAPWLVRNALVVGAPVLTTDTGRSLWLGNNPQTFSVYPERSIDRAEERAWAALDPDERAHVRSLASDELASDAWFRERALAHAEARPLEVVTGGLRKAWATFSPWYNPTGTAAKQVVHLLSYGPIALLALVTAWRRRGRWVELLPVALAAGLLALQSAVFYGHSSYRAYVDPLLVVLASAELALWWSALRARAGPGAAAC